MLGTIFLNVVIFIGGACGVLSCLYMVLSLELSCFTSFSDESVLEFHCLIN